MDRDQEQLQFLGFFGIFKESYKIIFSPKNLKIFSQITLSLITPLCFIFLAHRHISDSLFLNIINHEVQKQNDYVWSSSSNATTYSYHQLKHKLSSEWALFWLFNLAYFLFALVFSLLSTSAIVYTIACIYTSKDTHFKKIIRVVPKVWKRLLITFLWNALVMVVYNFFAIAVFVFWAVLVGSKLVGLVILLFLVVLYLMGFVYINVVWSLASVVSVLEEMYGLKAMRKSRGLVKGKLVVASAVYVVFEVLVVVVQVVYALFVGGGGSMDLGTRVVIGVGCFLVLVKLILLGIVVQTVVYFVCKSYHHESINKSCLGEHLDGYLGEYVRLREGRDHVQLEPISA